MDQSPSIQPNLTSQNVDNLPMFSPLNHLAYVPRNTVFPLPPFFQAQGSMHPRNNSTKRK